MYPNNYNDWIIAYTLGPAASIQQHTINYNDWTGLNNWPSFTDNNMTNNSQCKGNGCYRDV